MFLSGVGIDLQYIDSQITEKIIEHFMPRNIVVLPIHDSYIIMMDHVDELRDVMNRAWQGITQLTHKQSEVLGEPYNWTKTKQIGYHFEYEKSDPALHDKLLDEIYEEYVSQRYRDNVVLFREWKKIRRY